MATQKQRRERIKAIHYLEREKKNRRRGIRKPPPRDKSRKSSDELDREEERERVEKRIETLLTWGKWVLVLLILVIALISFWNEVGAPIVKENEKAKIPLTLGMLFGSIYIILLLRKVFALQKRFKERKKEQQNL